MMATPTTHTHTQSLILYQTYWQLVNVGDWELVGFLFEADRLAFGI